MRDYNSDTDRQIVRDAVNRVGPAGGVLAEVATALRTEGIRWPSNFNEDERPSALALDADICAAIGKRRKTMHLHEVNQRSITGQAIVNDRLVTEFSASQDIAWNHPAGTLVCEKPGDAERAEARKAFNTLGVVDYLTSITVTRLGVVFMDCGAFTERG